MTPPVQPPTDLWWAGTGSSAVRRVAAPERFILIFEYRDVPGPRMVGPFASRAQAFDWAYTYVGSGEATYYAAPFVSPEEAEGAR